MNPLKSDEIYGNWGTLLLPINQDDSIDYSRLTEEIDMLIGMQVNGIYSNGTAGEFYNQTESEFDKINQLLAEKCNAAGMPFQIGCSHMSPVTSLERVKRTISLKPGAIQIILPDWYPPSLEEIKSFLEKIAEAAGSVGLIIYNPPHAKRKLNPDEFGMLHSHIPSLLGCKVMGGDERWYKVMQKHVPGFSLFVAGHTLATGFQWGAHGAYSNVACLHPLAAQRWYEQMKTNLSAAMALETRIQQFMNSYISPLILKENFSPQACDKLLAAIGGWASIGTRLRWPYRSIPEVRVGELREKAKELLPEFFLIRNDTKLDNLARSD